MWIRCETSIQSICNMNRPGVSCFATILKRESQVVTTLLVSTEGLALIQLKIVTDAIY